jgi:Tol biopolymer transport system component
VPTLTRLTWDLGLTTDPALSADGKLLAYASDRSGEGHLDIYVQQVGGGEPLRLTRGPSDKREPAFSPDGTTIAFRSEEDNGIYLVSTLGGSARKLAQEGHLPQFSPDGRSITYSSAADWGGVFLSVPGQARIYVVASAGGTPRQIRTDFVGAAHPIWAPDGEHLLFLGNPDNRKPPEEAVDWWVTPLGPGPLVKTGALEATRRAKLSGRFQIYPWALVASSWEPGGGGLVFSARSGDSTNLWRIGISSRTWKVTGPPQRLTSGPTRDESPSVISGPGGVIRVAFTSVSEHFVVYGLRIKPNEGKVVGEPQQLTHGAAGDVMPALSPDGKKIVFVSLRPGSQEVWVKDLQTGQESALTATGVEKFQPIFSPDGSAVAFAEAPSQNIYTVPSTGGTPEMVCGGCGEATGWSSERIIGNTLDGRAWVLDLGSRRKRDLLDTRNWIATDTFCPDGHWFTFLDVTSWRAYIAPVRDAPVAESAWINVMDGEAWAWSPDGNLLYGRSDRDGHACIWAQRVHPNTKRPVGAPFAVFHLHNSRLALGGEDVTVGVAGEQMVFSMGERTANIWMAEWTGR